MKCEKWYSKQREVERTYKYVPPNVVDPTKGWYSLHDCRMHLFTLMDTIQFQELSGRIATFANDSKASLGFQWGNCIRQSDDSHASADSRIMHVDGAL